MKCLKNDVIDSWTQRRKQLPVESAAGAVSFLRSAGPQIRLPSDCSHAEGQRSEFRVEAHNF